MTDDLLNHEALHTASIVESMAATYLLEHPAIKSNPKWMAQAEKAHQALFDLYQLIGSDAADVDPKGSLHQ